MYQIINHETGVLITETMQVTFVKQQKRVDRPILAYNLGEADGVVFYVGDEEYQLGLAKEYAEGEPNMLNYKPVVDVIEVPSDAYIMSELNRVKAQVDSVHAYQTETTILKSELDESYREGVNSYGA